MNPNTIADGLVVSLAYTLEVDGEVVAQTEPGEPMDYLHGAENIVPGLEAALNGRKLGDKLSVTLAPDDAYGEYDPEDIDEIPREDVEPLEALEGAMVTDAEDAEEDVSPACVRATGNEPLPLNFTPPLAGKTLTYHVEVVGLREADDEEMAHGHVHGMYIDEDEDDDEG